jgi:two-component system, OmpR family, phosphate regulon sensor histidine kinase PhoR
VTAGGAAKRGTWVVLAAVCPGLAAGLACGASAGVQTGLLVGLAAAGVGAVVALLADADRVRNSHLEASSAAGRERAAQVERDTAAYGEKVLAAALEGIADGVWITDATGAVVRHNAALRRLLDAGEEVVGKRPLFLVRKGELHEAVLRACSGGNSSVVEVVMEGPRPRVLEVQVAPLGDGLPGSAAVFRDVTDLKRLERVRQDFVANVSHELRTPIAAILGYAETLQSGALTDAVHGPQMVDIIHRQSERLSELVTDLLELSRLDAGERPLAVGSVAVGEVVARAAEAVEPRAAAKHITITRSVPAGLAARGDAKALEQVLVNLLDNAVKYTPEGGSVELTAQNEASRVQLSVRDTGLGIEAKHLPRLFERFYRVDRGRSREMGGTGLGLSIVRHLVSAMGGDVRVQSQLGLGSTFTVTLSAG